MKPKKTTTASITSTGTHPPREYLCSEDAGRWAAESVLRLCLERDPAVMTPTCWDCNRYRERWTEALIAIAGAATALQYRTEHDWEAGEAAEAERLLSRLPSSLLGDPPHGAAPIAASGDWPLEVGPEDALEYVLADAAGRALDQYGDAVAAAARRALHDGALAATVPDEWALLETIVPVLAAGPRAFPVPLRKRLEQLEWELQERLDDLRYEPFPREREYVDASKPLRDQLWKVEEWLLLAVEPTAADEEEGPSAITRSLLRRCRALRPADPVKHEEVRLSA